ncbi:MAG: diaminopimelate epimerase [Bacteroidales bacterium]|nr:diaminopimelate epimerase [Bacteroidales bacterium]
MNLDFTKMEGLGNDYIYVDEARFPISDPGALSVRLSDRHFGIGADGLVLIGPSAVADFRMRMFNADGSEGLMCGNAARCIGKYVYEKGLTDKTIIDLDTASGVKRIHIHPGADGTVESVTVGMGDYRIRQRELTLDASGRSFTGMYVDLGNPHFVVFVPDADDVEIRRFGPVIEHSVRGGINVEFASVRPDGIRMRVWERGSGMTLACGTGACATAAAAFEQGLCPSPCSIIMDGGTLQISVQDGSLLQRGPAHTVFEGSVEV